MYNWVRLTVKVEIALTFALLSLSFLLSTVFELYGRVNDSPHSSYLFRHFYPNTFPTYALIA